MHPHASRLVVPRDCVSLLSSRVVGWSMDSRMSEHLVLRAMLAARWRRKPKQSVMRHSGHGGPSLSYERATFLADHNVQPNMSRRGKSHDDAPPENFQLLKREQSNTNLWYQ